MELKELVSQRRSYRKLKPIKVTPAIIKEFAEIAKLAPSCDNSQPWKFIYIYDEKKLDLLQEVFFEKNMWTRNASLLIGVFSKPDLDCKIEDRYYYQFDTGIAVSFILLRATEMGLVAHPTSYYNEKKAKEVMGIPEDMELITIIAVGKQDVEQKESEIQRPRRFSIQYSNFINRYLDEYNENKERLEKILEETR